MNEDDTFRRLIRIPFNDMVEIYLDHIQDQRKLTRPVDVRENRLEKLMSDHGWTLREFDETHHQNTKHVDENGNIV